MSNPLTRRALTFAAFAVPSAAQLDKVLSGIGKAAGTGGLGHAPNSDEKVASGLKEALSIGTTNAVKLTGVTDGYFANSLIKILLPPKVRTAEKALRVAGAGPQLDQFVLAMNRSAEKAAPEASKYFKQAIMAMTFSDARAILTGGETSATDFFKAKTSDQLTTAFRPHVEAAMGQFDVTRKFEGITASLQKIPFMKPERFDINDYVVRQAIGGIFIMVGEEEKKIRKDPAAQVTALLRDVFGRH